MHAITERITELKKGILDDLKTQAVKLGANAIIGLDFETTLPGGTVIMVSVSGTAVMIEKISD